MGTIRRAEDAFEHSTCDHGCRRHPASQPFGVQLVRLVGQSHPPLGFVRICAWPGEMIAPLRLIDQPTVTTARFHCRSLNAPSTARETRVHLPIVRYTQSLASVPLFVQCNEHGELLVRVASDNFPILLQHLLVPGGLLAAYAKSRCSAFIASSLATSQKAFFAHWKQKVLLRGDR
jgi:hypothetical protein